MASVPPNIPLLQVLLSSAEDIKIQEDAVLSGLSDIDTAINWLDEALRTGKFKKFRLNNRRTSLRLIPSETDKSTILDYAKLSKKDLASVREFATKFLYTSYKNGQFIFEIRDGDKVEAQASESTAKALQSGKYVLKNKKGKEVRYNSIKIVQLKDFQTIADHFKERLTSPQSAHAQVKSEDIAASRDENETPNVAPPDIAKTAVLATTTPKNANSNTAKTQEEMGKKTHTEEQRKEQEAAIKADREERKEEEKIAASVTKQEQTIKAEVQQAEVKKEDEQVVAEKKANQTEVTEVT